MLLKKQHFSQNSGGLSMSDDKTVWGQKWSTYRETLRGHFHMICGIIAWIVLHLVGIPEWLAWTLLVIFGGFMVFIDFLRVRASIGLKNKRNYKLSKWQARELRLIEIIFWTWQHIAYVFYTLILRRPYAFKNLENWFTPIHKWILENWLRGEKEEYHSATAIYFVAGMGLIYILFPVYIVVFAVLFQGVADPAAKWIGTHVNFVRFKKPKIIAGKSLGGVGAGFTACVLASFVVLTFDLAIKPLFPEAVLIPTRLAVIWVGCATAPIAELFGGKQDNFWIPVASATAMWLVL